MKKIFKGLIIGVSYAIPGVCSATTAITLNEYENILEIFSEFYKLKVLKKHILLIFGVLIGMLFAFFLISIFFNKYAWLLMFIFLLFNLSNIQINKKIDIDFLYTILGIIVVMFLTFKFKLNINSNLFYFIFSGLIVSLGFILPGLSGSLLMLNIGIYQYLINCVYDVSMFDYKIFTFMTALLFGIIFFGKTFKKILNKDNIKINRFIIGMFYGSIILLYLEIIKKFDSLFIKLLIILICILYLFIKQKVVKNRKI